MSDTLAPPAEIAKGVALLDKHFEGRRWTTRIDPGHLNMGDGHFCVLGQVFGTFNLGLIRLGLGDADGYRNRVEFVQILANGFDAESHLIGSPEYRHLTRVWRKWLEQQ